MAPTAIWSYVEGATDFTWYADSGTCEGSTHPTVSKEWAAWCPQMFQVGER